MGLLFNEMIKSNKLNYLQKKSKIIWLTLWNTKKNNYGISGIDIINFLINKFPNKILATVGCNINAQNIYKIMGFKSGTMSHYYILNPNIKTFKIIKLKKKLKPNNRIIKENLKLKNISLSLGYKKIKNSHKLEKTFYKNLVFFEKKYLKNPFYNYSFLFVENKKKSYLGFFVTKKILQKKNRILRIVDYFGETNNLPKLKNSFFKILIDNNYEAIDFLNYGIEKKKVLEMGFKLKKNDLVIPLYFEPFERKNRDLLFAYYPRSVKLNLFKGDCDQERPNILK